MDYLPIFVRLNDETALVVGGGEVAARKVSLLRRAGARVRVAAPVLGETLRASAAAGEITHAAKAFDPGDLDDAAIVIAAADDPAVNAAVAAAARARRLPVNVVDQPSLCSFIMPAIVDRGDIVVAVSTGGASPVLARLIRARLERALPAGIARAAAYARTWRARATQAMPDPRLRRRFWETIFQGPWGARIMNGETPDLTASLRAPPRPPQFTRIEIDPAAPDLLTLRAFRQIEAADIVLWEAGVPAEILEYVRRDAIRQQISTGTADIDADAAVFLADGRDVVALILAPAR